MISEQIYNISTPPACGKAERAGKFQTPHNALEFVRLGGLWFGALTRNPKSQICNPQFNVVYLRDVASTSSANNI